MADGPLPPIPNQPDWEAADNAENAGWAAFLQQKQLQQQLEEEWELALTLVAKPA